VNPIWLEAGPYTLRPPQSPDVAWIYDACQDAEIQRWTRVPSPYTAADAVSFYEMSRAWWADDLAYPFLISVTETGELLGACGAHYRGDDRTTIEIGYWVAKEGRGRGVATTALTRLVRWCRESLGVERVWAEVLVGNEASQRVLDRVGFTPLSSAATCEQRGEHRPALRYERQL
jgi:RimJ/RimL family protein N-acetyltransferase